MRKREENNFIRSIFDSTRDTRFEFTKIKLQSMQRQVQAYGHDDQKTFDKSEKEQNKIYSGSPIPMWRLLCNLKFLMMRSTLKLFSQIVCLERTTTMSYHLPSVEQQWLEPQDRQRMVCLFESSELSLAKNLSRLTIESLDRRDLCKSPRGEHLFLPKPSRKKASMSTS